MAIPDLHIPVDTPFSRQIEVPSYSVTIANIPAPSVGQHQGVVVNVYAPGPPACFGFATT